MRLGSRFVLIQSHSGRRIDTHVYSSAHPCVKKNDGQRLADLVRSRPEENSC